MDDGRSDDPDGASQAWQEVTSDFVDLGSRLRSFFEEHSEDEQPEEMQNAWTEFTRAASRLGRSVSSAFEDEEVQQGAKRAFSSLIDAVGQSVRDAGSHFGDVAGRESEDRTEPDGEQDDATSEADPPT